MWGEEGEEVKGGMGGERVAKGDSSQNKRRYMDQACLLSLPPPPT